jgi:RHS repeat-associated protein
MKRVTLLVAIVVLAGIAFGQNTGPGTPPFGSFTPGTLDVVNNQNLNVHLAIPFEFLRGRGIGFQFSEVNDSQIWAPVTSGSTTSWMPVVNAAGSATWGWQTAGPNGSLSSLSKSNGTCGNVTMFNQTNFVYSDSRGTNHPFPSVNVSESCSNGTIVSGGTPTGYAADNSGYFVNATIGIVYAPNGVKYSNSGNIVTDTNGNYITQTIQSSTVTSWTDSSGTTALTATTNSSVNTVTYADPNNKSVVVGMQIINIKTNFGCPGVAEYTGTATVPSSITLPNGAVYRFLYEPTPGNSGFYTGRLQAVTLPIVIAQIQGYSVYGSIQYAYSGTNDGINCADGTTMGLTRTDTSAGFTTNNWAFGRSGSSGAYSTTVTAPQLSYDPVGNDTVYSFDTNGHEISRKIYEGTAGGTPLRTINTTWATSNGTPATSVTILDDNQTQSEVDTTYDQTSPTGNLQAMTEYDWGSGQHGPPLRQTNYTYVTDTNYTSRNIVNLLKEVTIQTGSTIQSRKDIAYDGALITSCPTAVPQHDDTNYGCSFVYRGNPTLVTTYTDPVTPGGAITRGFTYDFFGNLLTAQLSCCQQKTWVYSGSTNYSFPDSITSGSSPSLTTTYTYNSAGQVLTVTDPNNLKTTYAYNTAQGFAAGAGPLTSITRPDGSVVKYGYSGASVTTTSPIDSSHNVIQVTQPNGIGQPIVSTLEDGGGNVISNVQYQYDALNRLTATSNPYAGGTPGYFTTTRFDALGRPTTTILPDGEQTTYAYSAQLVTVTDPTGKQSKGKADAAGRLIEADQAGGTTGAATPGTGIETVNVAGTAQVSISGSEQNKTNSSLAIDSHWVAHSFASSSTISTSFSTSSSNELLLAFVAGSGSGNTVTGVSGAGVTWQLVRRTNTQSGTTEVWRAFSFGSVSGATVTATFSSSNTGRLISVYGIKGADQTGQNGSGAIGATASGSSSAGAPTASLVTTRNNSWVFGVGDDPTHSTGRSVGSGQTVDQTGNGSNLELWDQRETSATASSGTQVTLNDTAPTGDPYNFTAVEVLAAIVSYDTGTVTLTVNGHGDIVSYGQNDTPSTVATALANAINGDSAAFVNATPATNSGNQFLDLTARTTGSSSDYAVSTTSATNNSNFTRASFGGSSTSLSPGSVFDSGTVSVTVNGVQSTASYSPGDTASTVAGKIATAVSANSSTSHVTATATGSDVVLVATSGGTTSNYSVSSGSQGGTYSQASFSLALSGPTLTGATNGGGPSISAPAATYYTYDVLDDLTQATDRINQTRTYTYDALGRPLSSVTPEGGMTCFGTVSGSTCNSANAYDSFNNLLIRTDARGVVTSYSYDGLNRVKQVSYNVGSTGVPATPTVIYTYGTNPAQFNNGLLVSMTDGPGTDTYTYDNMGRKTQCVRVITGNGVSYTTSYAYDELNEVTQTTYPSGRVVQQSYDAVARLCEVAPSTTGCGTAASPYATGYAYNVASQVTGFNYGNGVAASATYSPDRLQLTSLAYAKGTSTLFSLNYAYGQNGGNDGQITGITDNVDGGRSTAYGYDALSRLVNASTAGSTNYAAWGLSWTYDQYGNRTQQQVTAGTAPPNSVIVNPATNQITTAGYGYDANGNMTNDGVNALTYDAENRVASINSGVDAYTYDGYGRRIEKTVSGATTVYIFSNSQVIAEYASTAAVTSPTREYVYGGSGLLAKIEGSATQYYHQDHLSNRLMTDSSGNVVGQQGHYPYGEQWYPVSPNQMTKWEFTSYERDAESNNDDAMARYYVNRLGRFSSADSKGGSPSNPQSVNRYVYALGDPINNTDPTGQDPAPCFMEVDEWISTYPDGRQVPGIPPDIMSVTFFGNCGGGGGVGGSVSDFAGKLANAIKKALEALQDPKCAGLFANNVNPTDLLQNLISGGWDGGSFGSLGYADLGGPYVDPSDNRTYEKQGQTTGPDNPDSGTPGQAIITINSNPAAQFTTGFGGYRGYDDDTWRAAAIIHELGHAANFVFGMGASAIIDDRGSSMKSNLINNSLVLNDCFPKN